MQSFSLVLVLHLVHTSTYRVKKARHKELRTETKQDKVGGNCGPGWDREARLLHFLVLSTRQFYGPLFSVAFERR